jgi:dihydroorotase-like cyclic amidohydrolase
VSGRTVLTPGGQARADLLISDRMVGSIGPGLAGSGGRLDASGCYVPPGGVDPHAPLICYAG